MRLRLYLPELTSERFVEERVAGCRNSGGSMSMSGEVGSANVEYSGEVK